MGKIINSTFVSIDGVINHMEAWHFAYTDDEAGQIATEQLLASDALLMGRTTYEGYAAIWPQRDGVYPDTINSMPKYVVSSTLDRAGWANTTVIKGDLVDEVSKLRQQGGDILMHGFGPVAQTLIRHGLLDELHLWVPAAQQGSPPAQRPRSARGEVHGLQGSRQEPRSAPRVYATCRAGP